jgi:hypothetical protein
LYLFTLIKAVSDPEKKAERTNSSIKIRSKLSIDKAVIFYI